MKICNFLKADHVFLDKDLPDKDDVLRFLAETGYETGLVKNKNGLMDGLLRRERIMSTGVGDGIALRSRDGTHYAEPTAAAYVAERLADRLRREDLAADRVRLDPAGHVHPAADHGIEG